MILSPTHISTNTGAVEAIGVEAIVSSRRCIGAACGRLASLLIQAWATGRVNRLVSAGTRAFCGAAPVAGPLLPGKI